MEPIKTAEYYFASSKLWLARMYMHDLTEYNNGDVNRFGRMVGSHGEGLGSERQWITHLQNILVRSDMQTYFPAELAELRNAFAAMGHELETEPKPEQEPKPHDLNVEARPQTDGRQQGQPDQVAPSKNQA